MKLNVKSLTLLLSMGVVLSLSGCGGGSSTSTATTTGTVTEAEPGPGEVGYQVISEDNQTVTYLDANLVERNATVTTGASEYHAITGFGHTMFDSADKKCQNCHNELYDTWKSSMHGKSWTDPIFQGKFQDFLRTHLAKINDTTYTETKFKGVAQTCIKCHAPGAYYAGDVEVKVNTLMVNPQTSDLNTAKENNQSSDPTGQIAVVSASGFTDKLYQATFEIGHEANQEGINCAFCHSIETVRMMKADGADGGQYTLKDALREGPIGVIKYDPGTILKYNEEATDPHMNGFFRLWGPEKYTDPSTTPKTGEFDVNKAKDGRYTMHSVELNNSAVTNTEGEVHFTGGPFYGPYGVTGISNENESDETNRSALVSESYHKDTNNHFGNHGKALCLSCHQRSAGALDPNSDGDPVKDETTDNFMELCSTWNAVTAGTDTNHNDEATSPKCQKCHMERIEGTVLHQWARPDKLFTLADNPALTEHFDPEDTTVADGDNPVRDGWLNSHAFLGASLTGHDKESVVAKIKSGFNAVLEDPVVEGDTLTVTTRLQNLTAHMFPGAHPMRRVFTRVIVKDENNETIHRSVADGNSSFGQITNDIETLVGKTLHSSGDSQIVLEDGGRVAHFPGQTADLDGSEVEAQKFDFATKVTIVAPDGTVKSQIINADGAIEGQVGNAAIIDDTNKQYFTRIYGHETGKFLDHDGDALTPNIFVVRPGFDSNTVPNDNRLSPNETETYDITYDINGKTGVTVTYKVYYMQKGASGVFPDIKTGSDAGWLDEVANTEKGLKITEVYSETKVVK